MSNSNIDDELEELRIENEELRYDIEDLKFQIDDVRQESFFSSNDLRQKLADANEEIEQISESIKEMRMKKSFARRGSDDYSISDSSSVASYSTFHTSMTQESYTSKASVASRVDLDRAKREIKKLKMKLSYTKLKKRMIENSMPRCSSDQFLSSCSFFLDGSDCTISTQDTFSHHTCSRISGSNSSMKSQKVSQLSKEKINLQIELEALQIKTRQAKKVAKELRMNNKNEGEELLKEIDKLYNENIRSKQKISNLTNSLQEKKRKLKTLRPRKLSNDILAGSAVACDHVFHREVLQRII